MALPVSIKAEAAAWLARLHADDRSSEDELRFRVWLAEDERHQEAFEVMTISWDAVGGLKYQGHQVPARRVGIARSVAAVVTALVLAVVAVWRPADPEIFFTQPMEIRRVVLADGSAVVLDAETLISFEMHGKARNVRLEHGRAHFQVAPDPDRQFSVVANGEKVTALGTSFDVELDRKRVSVTLLTGKVSVSSEVTADFPPNLMAPGERLVFEDGRVVLSDRPDMLKTQAWLHRQAVFNSETLAEAVRQMNRYNRRPLVLGDASVAALQLSGVYSTSDSLAFAQSIASLLPVTLEVSSTKIVLRADLRRVGRST